jgi:hypothetical protein
MVLLNHIGLCNSCFGMNANPQFSRKSLHHIDSRGVEPSLDPLLSNISLNFGVPSQIWISRDKGMIYLRMAITVHKDPCLEDAIALGDWWKRSTPIWCTLGSWIVVVFQIRCNLLYHGRPSLSFFYISYVG